MAVVAMVDADGDMLEVGDIGVGAGGNDVVAAAAAAAAAAIASAGAK